MKKLYKILTALFACAILLICGAACVDEPTVNRIQFKTLTVDGDTVYGKVDNETETFSFVDEVETFGAAKFIVSLDVYGLLQVPTKTISLEIGDNTVYVTKTVDEEPVSVYTVTLRRRPMYTVTFNTDGGTAVQSQTVEEDGFATLPIEVSQKAGYTFDKWDFDFATPITENTTINASWKINLKDLFLLSNGIITALTDIGKTLTEISIPQEIDGVKITSIGERAFYDCSSLTSVVIPDSVKSIGNSAFVGCSSLTSVVIPDSVTSIDVGAFALCGSLTSITVSGNNTAYQSIDGNLYSKDGKTLIQYAIGKTATSFAIPDGVESIGELAFAECRSLTSVVIGDGVESIGNYAFYYCDGLTRVVIGDGVESIGYYAFYYCYNLTIYCEAESQPSGWNSAWNSYNCPVVWGYKKEN